MIIQSLSIDVPANCLNNCEFCVARMHREDYENQIENNTRFYDLYANDFKKRLLFARDNGCNTVMLTGNGEPLLNKKFLKEFATLNNSLDKPFRKIELQTSGTLLDDEYLRFLRNTVGVNTISLSLSDVFSSENNAIYNKTHRNHIVDIDRLCKEIKRYDFNLRLSLNMTDVYNDKSPVDIFNRCEELKADQITFRKLYKTPKNEYCNQNKWIDEHGSKHAKLVEIEDYIVNNGVELETLNTGAIKYSIHSFGVVIDKDCMSQNKKEEIRYLILRPNCKLYSKWDDKNSLIF